MGVAWAGLGGMVVGGTHSDMRSRTLREGYSHGIANYAKSMLHMEKVTVIP